MKTNNEQSECLEERLLIELHEITKKHDKWKYAMHLYKPFLAFIKKEIAKERMRLRNEVERTIRTDIEGIYTNMIKEEVIKILGG